MNVQFEAPPPVRRYEPNEEAPLTDDQYLARELMNGPSKHICLVGGARAGKTAVIVRNILMRAQRVAESRHLITRFRANALRASIWLDTFPKVKRLWFPGLKTESNRMDGYEELPNGSQVWFGGLDEKERVDKILGQEYATVFNNEVSQTPYSSVLTVRTRLAQVCEFVDRRGNVRRLRLKEYNDLNPTTVNHWSNLEFGLHKDPMSRKSLPNPKDFVRLFMNPEGNRDNLDPGFLQSLRNMPERFRKRFYEGQYVVAVEGALWTPDKLALCRADPIQPDPRGRRLGDFKRVVVGVDPSGAKEKDDKKSDAIGIVVAGHRHTNRAAVLEDATMKGGPTDWGMRAVAAYRRWHADLIVAEANFGGAMVASTIRAVDRNVPVKLVHASRGKHVRAEPVSALYGEPDKDDSRVDHCGEFIELEDELCEFSTGGFMGTRSPNRADALVWCLTELMLENASTYTLAHVR